MEAELQSKINGLNHQIELLSNKRNTIIEVNRTAKTALEVFDDLLHKTKMERNDLELMMKKIDAFTRIIWRYICRRTLTRCCRAP